MTTETIRCSPEIIRYNVRVTMITAFTKQTSLEEKDACLNTVEWHKFYSVATGLKNFHFFTTHVELPKMGVRAYNQSINWSNLPTSYTGTLYIFI